MLSPFLCMFYVKWSLVEYKLFRRREADNRTEVRRRRDRKSWICWGGGCEYSAFNHKWTKTSWAAGGFVQKLGGRMPETQPLVEGICTDTQHRLLHCPVGGLGSPVLQLPDPPMIHSPVGGKRGIWWQLRPSPLLYLGTFWANCCQ